MKKFFIWFLVAILAVFLIAIIVLCVITAHSNSLDGNYCLVRIYNGSKIYQSNYVEYGSEFELPIEDLAYLTDDTGNAFVGLTENNISLITDDNIVITDDTDLFVVYSQTVQVVFSITNGTSTVNTTIAQVIVGKTIGNIAPTLADDHIWTISWTESGSNIGLQLSSEDIQDFIVLEPIIFICEY